MGGAVGSTFTDRRGGVSTGPFATLNLGGHVGDDPAAVMANRALVLADRLPGATAGPVYLRQVHGSTVVALDAAPADVPEADGVVTATPGLALGVLVADCAPVLLADAVGGVVGAAHAGWRGLAAGAVPAVVRRMAALGADPRRIAATVGPCICSGCYEVGADVRDQVAAGVTAAAATTRPGAPAVDLRAGVEAQLRAAGVDTVTHDRRCTVEEPDLFSYRRDGVTGRFGGFVWLRR